MTVSDATNRSPRLRSDRSAVGFNRATVLQTTVAAVSSVVIVPIIPAIFLAMALVTAVGRSHNGNRNIRRAVL